MEINTAWQTTDADQELFQRELEPFVPRRIFDAHCHLYRKSQFAGTLPPLVAQGPDEAGWDVFREYSRALTPGRDYSALGFGFPAAGVDFEAANNFAASEVRRDPASRGAMLVEPGMDPEFVRGTVRRGGFVGLKCYHGFADTQPAFEAEIPRYLPEQQVRVAHEERLSITLHLVRPRALADAANQQAIRWYAERYPEARLILAHAARGFNPHHTVEGIGALRGLHNVWFDSSAVTDCGALEAIIETMGAGRLLYGSDFPVSMMRARCVALGDSFLWISAENTSFKATHAQVAPSLTGLESLRVLKLACRHLRLKDSEIETIFFGNAAELFSLRT